MSIVYSIKMVPQKASLELPTVFISKKLQKKQQNICMFIIRQKIIENDDISDNLLGYFIGNMGNLEYDLN